MQVIRTRVRDRVKAPVFVRDLSTFYRESAFSKIDYINDPASRLRVLIDQWEPRLRREFLEMVSQIRGQFTLKNLEELIVRGQIEEAFRQAEAYIVRFADLSNDAFIASARDTSTFFHSAAIVVNFDQVNYRAVRMMQQNRLEFVREFLEEQRTASRNAMIEGITRGLNPREQARMFRDSIGLTTRQERAVANYQRLLEELNPQALSRKLRDGRFDRTIRAAIKDQKGLSPDKISRMVGRYRERYIKYRSEVIARTEALRSVHQGNEELYQQAFDSGKLSPEDIERQWHVTLDGRQRDPHGAMHGQTRRYGEPFTSGAGNSLRYPGDPEAPADEIIQCRCAVGTVIRRNPNA